MHQVLCRVSVLLLSIAICSAGSPYRLCGVGPDMQAREIARVHDIDEFEQASGLGLSFPLPLGHASDWWVVSETEDLSLYFSFPQLYDPNEQSKFTPKYLLARLSGFSHIEVVRSALIKEWGAPKKSFTLVGVKGNRPIAFSCDVFTTVFEPIQARVCSVMPHGSEAAIILERARPIDPSEVDDVKSRLFNTPGVSD